MQSTRLDGLIGANQTMMSLMPQMKLSPGQPRSHHQLRLDRVAEWPSVPPRSLSSSVQKHQV
ncbi:uncharacterized protein Dmoj_GI25865 [Drosophila mojavensis]|uniref:Uncharacterized protein n=1 Tax=Drosophila mojavensis TaxID=7230 RepID=A0A0Q9XAG3_DROMO|nr:uncharacterized protein Dmoj_GI25865 [Drosophila mojavensis]